VIVQLCRHGVASGDPGDHGLLLRGGESGGVHVALVDRVEDSAQGGTTQHIETTAHHQPRARHRLGDRAGHRAAPGETPHCEIPDSLLVTHREDPLVHSSRGIAGRPFAPTEAHRVS
jgi:hypothetical protein